MGVSMLTDVYIRSEHSTFRAFDNDDRNIISRVGNARIREWESNVDFILRAPELEMRIHRNLPEGTEFQVRLHNLSWFFRSVEEHEPAILIDDNYSGGIELLLPTNYNRFRGLFVPSGTGTGGTYTRIVGIDSREVPYKLIVSDTDDREATIVLLRNVRYGDIIRIPLIAKSSNYLGNAAVEVIGTSDRAISSGIYSVLAANPVGTENMRRNPTNTTATIHMTGIEQIRIPEIVIRENTHGVLGNGSIMLTAPEGFIIIPDVDYGELERITRTTPSLRDEDGAPIINVTLGGGLNWRNLLVNDELYQQNAAAGTDFRLHYRNPAGNLDASILIIELNNIVQSRFREPGYLVISGLRLVAVGDVSPGAQYMNISAFSNMEDLTEQSFRVGSIVE